MARWPTYVQLNVYGYDDYFYGDTDGDGIMDRLPPNSAGKLNILSSQQRVFLLRNALQLRTT